MKIKQQNSSITVNVCPNCNQSSMIVSCMLTGLYKQCLRCGYAIHREHRGLNDDDTSHIVSMLAKSPIGCAILKYNEEQHKAVISIPNQEAYESFLIYLQDNKDSIEYCTLSTFKDNIFSETNLMELL